MSDELPKFKPGDHVTWTSQAGGRSKTKQGIVVRVIEPFQLPGFNLPEGCTIKPTGGHRDHESYLVQVGKSKWLYWPLVKYLEKTNGECGKSLGMDYDITEKDGRMQWADLPKPDTGIPNPDKLQEPQG